MKLSAPTLLKQAAYTLLAGALVSIAGPARAGSGPWGAIAVATHGNGYGYSVNWPTRQGAEAAALSECRGSNSSCTIRYWFRDEYIAIVRSGSDYISWGWSPSYGGARARALDKCRQQASDPGDCHVELVKATGNP